MERSEKYQKRRRLMKTLETIYFTYLSIPTYGHLDKLEAAKKAILKVEGGAK